MWHRQSSGVAALRDGLSHLPPGAEKAALSYVDMVARLSLPGGSMAGDSLATRLAWAALRGFELGAKAAELPQQEQQQQQQQQQQQGSPFDEQQKRSGLGEQEEEQQQPQTTKRKRIENSQDGGFD